MFESREVVYWTSKGAACLAAVDAPWIVRWDTPAVFRDTLSVAEFKQFKSFLARADVSEIGPFMNAGPGVGNFQIIITRESGNHQIDVVSFRPTHTQFVEKPALLQLICRAKDMAQRASWSGELPDWCKKP